MFQSQFLRSGNDEMDAVNTKEFPARARETRAKDNHPTQSQGLTARPGPPPLNAESIDELCGTLEAEQQRILGQLGQFGCRWFPVWTNHRGGRIYAPLPNYCQASA